MENKNNFFEKFWYLFVGLAAILILTLAGLWFLNQKTLSEQAKKQALANELFDHVASGRIKIEINQRYELKGAVQAHRDLEARKTIGSSIFVI